VIQGARRAIAPRLVPKVRDMVVSQM